MPNMDKYGTRLIWSVLWYLQHFCHIFAIFLIWYHWYQAIGLLVRFLGVMASMLPMDLAAFKAIDVGFDVGSWGKLEPEKPRFSY